VLQRRTHAVTVSWFPADGGPSLGVLQVIRWAGVVVRRGVAPAPGARPTPEWEAVYRLVEASADTVDTTADTRCAWQVADDLVVGTAELAARCRALLADSARAAERGGIE
jgi:hypothetical protein